MGGQVQIPCCTEITALGFHRRVQHGGSWVWLGYCWKEQLSLLLHWERANLGQIKMYWKPPTLGKHSQAGERQGGCAEPCLELHPSERNPLSLMQSSSALCAKLAVPLLCQIFVPTAMLRKKNVAVKCSFCICSNSFLQKIKQLSTH